MSLLSLAFYRTSNPQAQAVPLRVRPRVPARGGGQARVPDERAKAVEGSGSRFLGRGPAGRVTVELGPATVYTGFDGALRVLRGGCEHARG